MALDLKLFKVYFLQPITSCSRCSVIDPCFDSSSSVSGGTRFDEKNDMPLLLAHEANWPHTPIQL